MTDSIHEPTADEKEVHRQPEGPVATSPPDPEVVARPKRRTLTIAYKIRILNAVVALRDEGHGAVGAFLRKEGLYYSAVKKWEQQYADGHLGGTQRGAHEKSHAGLLEENKQLKRKLERLEQRLEKTELIVELQKKLSSILEPDPIASKGKQGAR